MTNEKQKIVRNIYFNPETWQIIQAEKEKYKAKWSGEKKPFKNIGSNLVDRAVNIFYSDNAFEEISNMTGLKPKKIDISGWIEKNWQKIRITKSETDDCIFFLRCDHIIDFDITIDVTRNSNDEVIEIHLIKDQSLYIPGVELVWNVKSLMILADFLN